MDGGQLPLMDFVLASILMAVGIGTDVALATLTRARHLKRSNIALLWIIGVSFTHTLFPMFGYLLTFFSIQLHPIITPGVGLLAFGLIALYLKDELCEYKHNQAGLNGSSIGSSTQNGDRVDESMSSKESGRDSRQLMVTLGLILAVSWDALWSGPAKSAQVVGWPELWVWGSFIVVGVVISLLAIAALRLGYQLLNRAPSTNAYWWRLSAALVQYTVIGYFGLLALTTYTFALNIPWWLLAQCSCGMVVLTMFVIADRPTLSAKS